MSAKRPSEWPVLFNLAVDILDHFRKANGFAPQWSFGGGTALMLQIDLRESHDIDLFLDDPQILPFLNPETQGIKLDHAPDSYQAGTDMLKLAYHDLGEIDFICCDSIIPDPTRAHDVQGHAIALETPAEIIAKKVFYRGWSFQPRDMFDLAAVAEHFGPDYVVGAIEHCGRARCETALAVINKTNPAYVEGIIGQLMLREKTRNLVAHSREISRDLIGRASAKQPILNPDTRPHESDR